MFYHYTALALLTLSGVIAGQINHPTVGVGSIIGIILVAIHGTLRLGIELP